MAAKADGPSGSGSKWSAPVVTGAVTIAEGRASAAMPEIGVRPGAQEAASSARRRKGSRRRRAGPYTSPCYYGFVYLSRQLHGSLRERASENGRYNSAALPTMHFFL